MYVWHFICTLLTKDKSLIFIDNVDVYATLFLKQSRGHGSLLPRCPSQAWNGIFIAPKRFLPAALYQPTDP